MTTHPHFFRHDPSGDVYAIPMDDNGMLGDICGPLPQDEQTADNLAADSFHYDYDDEWMGNQTWYMILPDNPLCNCPQRFAGLPVPTWYGPI